MKDEIFFSKQKGKMSKPIKVQDIPVESSYRGLELKFPITKQNFHDLINFIKENKALHVKYVIMLLEETIRKIKQIKTINHISTKTSKNLTIVGDLHVKIFEKLFFLNFFFVIYFFFNQGATRRFDAHFL
jgi:hypothetical protein